MPSISELIEFLDENDSLRIGDSPWGEEDLSDYDIYNVDWERLIVKENGWELSHSESVGEFERLIWDIERGIKEPTDLGKDGWDVCAWYQPIHYHGHGFGIYIKEECIINLAKKIAAFLEFPLQTKIHSNLNIIESLIRTSFCLYYLHELYHHKTESFCIRLHVIEGISRYIPYFDKVYKKNSGTDNQLEEAIANAFMYRNINNYNKYLKKPFVDAAKKYLKNSFPQNPPSYREAPLYLSEVSFYVGENSLKGQIQESTLTPSKTLSEWGLASRVNHPFFNLTNDISVIVPKRQRSVIPTTSLSLKTCSSDEMISICKKFGYSIFVDEGKGSHMKGKNPDPKYKTITLSSNKDNLGITEVKNILKTLGNFKIRDIPSLLKTKKIFIK